MGGFLPIPFFAIGGERIKTEYKQVNDLEAQARERDISRRKLSQEQMSGF